MYVKVRFFFCLKRKALFSLSLSLALSTVDP